MIDLHVHSAPCLLPRLADDVQTVEWYERAGFAGCVLKSHWESTVGRAAAAGAGRTIRVHGGLVLNHAAGGLSPAAVDAALRLGARVIWMPTVDARGHAEARLPRPEGAPGGATLAVPPREPGAACCVHEILKLVAEADVVLATGHLSAVEVGWLVRAARDAGVRRMLVTHATFLVPALGAAELRELVELGASVEITAYQLLHQVGCDAAQLAMVASALRPDRVVLSSDAGQPDSPPGPEALLTLLDALEREGVDRAALEAMASENPAQLLAAS
ncbi:MAG TPA: DUF6282 family protein [Gaiellaceae bacterium]|nr:DUF6282 family protein [Gaiellaceae bacterium]